MTGMILLMGVGDAVLAEVDEDDPFSSTIAARCSPT